jgi:hypothetical protein
MGVMPKKKLKKQSGEALLSKVRKEMAQPRAAASTRSEVSGASCPKVDGMLPAKFVARPESAGRMVSLIPKSG